MGLLNSIASIFGASSAKKAVGRAADATVAGLQQGVDGLNTGLTNSIGALQAGNDEAGGILSNFGVQNGDAIRQLMAMFAPYTASGQAAVTGRDNLAGINGLDAQNAGVEAISASPLYQRLLGAGQNQVLSAASATGGLRGGNVQRDLADFGADTLGKAVNSQIGNFNSIAQQGLGATGSAVQTGLQGQQQQGGIAQLLASLASGEGANIANLTTEQAAQLATLFGQQGQARAGGILGKNLQQQKVWQGVATGIGDIAGAFAGGGGGGAGASQLAQLFV